MRLAIIVLQLICLGVGLQSQEVSYNQEFQVNTYIKDCPKQPCAIGLSDSSFVVCWQSECHGSGSGIYGQIYNKYRVRSGSEFHINSYIDYCQRYACVTNFEDGGFVVSWQSYGQDGYGESIHCQIYDKTYSSKGSEFMANSYIKDWQRFPSVCYQISNRFIVCWQSWLQDGSGFGIFCQQYFTDGTKCGSEFQVNTYTNSDQIDPHVSGLKDGGFVVCWTSQRDGNNTSISGRIYNYDGTERSPEFQVNTYIIDNQIHPAVAGLKNGGFVVCWKTYEDVFQGSSIHAQLYDSKGNKQGKEFQVDSHKNIWQDNPSVSALNNGEFVICWEGDKCECQDANTECGEIFAQLFNSTGSKKGVEFKINTRTEYKQNNPSISGLEGGGFVVCWESFGQFSFNYGIFGKYYLASPLVHHLQPFSLLQPSDDVLLNSIKQTFKWSRPSDLHENFPWELEYHLYLDENADFSSPRIITAIYDTTCVVDSLVPGQNYYWKVLAKNIEDDSLWSSETFVFLVSPDVGIEDNANTVTSGFTLFGNYPNPFNAETMISYELTAGSVAVSIKIYNIAGQVVRVFNNPPQTAGLNKLKWDGQDNNGQSLPSGIYFCTMEVDGHLRDSQKMILIK